MHCYTLYVHMSNLVSDTIKIHDLGVAWLNAMVTDHHAYADFIIL